MVIIGTSGSSWEHVLYHCKQNLFFTDAIGLKSPMLLSLPCYSFCGQILHCVINVE